MENDLLYQERMIKTWLYELNSIFSDLENEVKLKGDSEKVEALEENFAFLARKIVTIGVAYFEFIGASAVGASFKGELLPQLNDKKKLLGCSLREENGEYYSNFTSTVWGYLNSSEGFKTGHQ